MRIPLNRDVRKRAPKKQRVEISKSPIAVSGVRVVTVSLSRTEKIAEKVGGDFDLRTYEAKGSFGYF